MTRLFRTSVVAVLAAFVWGAVLAEESPATPAAATTKAPVRLNNDAPYQAALQNLLDHPPAADAPANVLIGYHLSLTFAWSHMRDYAKAESEIREAMKRIPGDVPMLHANLSVYLGKQGKYAEASEEAQKAIELNSEDTMHPTMVLASWKWNLGKKDEALALIRSVPVPDEANRAKRNLYYCCLACFQGDVGDEKILEDAIRQALATDDADHHALTFFSRDVVFDPYRAKPWFIALIGKTLLEDPAPTPKKDAPAKDVEK